MIIERGRTGISRQRPVTRPMLSSETTNGDSNNNHNTAPGGRSLRNPRSVSSSQENLDRANSRSTPNLNDAVILDSSNDSSPTSSNYQNIVIQGKNVFL